MKTEIEKLNTIIFRLQSRKDYRLTFFENLLEWYTKKGFLSEKQLNCIRRFDLNYCGKQWTARPRRGR